MPTPGKANIVPGVRYRDAETAIEFLCNAFGFERHLVVPGEAPGEIAHAQGHLWHFGSYDPWADRG